MYEVTLHRGVDIDDRGDIGEVFLRWEDPDTGNVTEIDEDIDLRDVAPDVQRDSYRLPARHRGHRIR